MKTLQFILLNNSEGEGVIDSDNMARSVWVIYRGQMRAVLIEMKEGMVNRGEGIPQRHNTIEVLMSCVDEQ